MRIAVLGAGMVGRTIANDLQASYEVTSFDIDDRNLSILKSMNERISVEKANLLEFHNYPSWLNPFDFVVTAVPGFMGYACLEAVIKAGKSVADISFFPEDPMKLDALAKQKGVTVITDAGVAPGMSNYILGYLDSLIAVKRFECYVGGLPLFPQPPFLYKAPFSPIDVIEEYTRPARLKESGKIVIKEALTDRSIIDFSKPGKLEAFNTDGLRTLLFTMSHIPDLKEQTLRYPGHLDLIIALRTAGFFSTNAFQFNDREVRPLDFSAAYLIDQWKMGPADQDITVMKVVVVGFENEAPVQIEYDLYDQYDPATGFSSMSRTTGFTCTASLELIIKDKFTEKGVFPPELVAKTKGCFPFVLNYLQERGVNWRSTKR
jgi:saccharopine dehydrogenase-like NADP-dependent oxidoreductase